MSRAPDHARNADRPWLPALLFDMAEAHGLQVALDFAARFGGRPLYLPARRDGTHPVERAFGPALLDWLIAQHGAGRHITIPLGPTSPAARRRVLVQQLLRRGEKPDAIAAAACMHVRDVYRWKARLERQARAGQGDLFGGAG
jgi:hypothetical protein